MRPDVSIEVAEHVLRRFQALNLDPIVPYRTVSCPGRFPPGPRVFHTAAQVRDDAQIRNGRMLVINPAFKLQQWLAAEILIQERWPKHRSFTVPVEYIDRIEVDRLSLFSLPPRKRNSSKRT